MIAVLNFWQDIIRIKDGAVNLRIKWEGWELQFEPWLCHSLGKITNFLNLTFSFVK